MAEKPFAGVTLARILRPWGRRGEVAAQLFSDFPERLKTLREVWLSDGRNPPRSIRVESCRMHIGQALFHFAGVDSINDAERLRGLEVLVPGERLPLDPGRHYVTDLIGCQVWEQDAAEPLGSVEDVQNSGALVAGARPPESWILAVATPQGELLIPMAAEICTRIDTAARRIEVRLPAGLRELNERPRRNEPRNERPKNSHPQDELSGDQPAKLV